MISCKILADSISPAGHHITTWELTYPRFIHSEILTHRQFARNAASSRAIPIEKMIDAVLTNPATFEQYGAANKGMQAQTQMDETTQAQFLEDWTRTAQQAAHFATLWKDSAAKQMVNRALEPWAHMTAIVTATDWHNFYALRAHPDAQPEFQVLAYRMLDVYLKASPVKIDEGQWHLPLITDEEWNSPLTNHALRKVSVARCARVSYTRHGTASDVEKDIELHDRLLSSGHMSPFEHQATPQECSGDSTGCYTGWVPYRKMLPNENRTNVDLHAILASKPEWVTL